MQTSIKSVTASIAVIVLCGWGWAKSDDDKKAELVKCNGYMAPIGKQIDSGQTGFINEVNKQLSGDPEISNRFFAMGRASVHASVQMDSVRSLALQEEGARLARKHLREFDKQGATNFLKGCLTTFESLAKSK